MVKKNQALCAIVIGMGIAAPSSWSQTSSSGGTERMRYELTIRTKQVEFIVGDEVRVEIATKNISGQPFLAAPVIPTAETKYSVDVRDARGDQVPETKVGRINRTGKDDFGRETVAVFKSGLIGNLQPGATMREEIVLNRLVDLSKPGTYKVQVQVRGDDKGLPKSNTITIIIKAENPK